jgi:recombination protein RecT
MNDLTTTPDAATAVAPARQLTPIQSLAKTLEGPYADKIKAALDGTGMSPERFTRTALAALNANKYLVDKCSRDSIIVAVMNAASLGLELNPAMGHASIVPRGDQAVLQVQYKGKIHLAQQHPKIAAVAVGTICEKDRYEFCEGTHAELKVWPALGDRGAPIAYYCVTHYANGTAVPTLMSHTDVEAHRDKFSDAFKRGGAGANVWKQHFEAMAYKTVVHRASKLWPLAIPSDDSDDGEWDHDRAPMRDVTPAPRGGAAALDALAENL